MPLVFSIRHTSIWMIYRILTVLVNFHLKTIKKFKIKAELTLVKHYNNINKVSAKRPPEAKQALHQSLKAMKASSFIKKSKILNILS
jgi:hypothetical protein